MVGQRLPDGFECTRPELDALGLSTTPHGSYWRDSQNVWCVVTPNGRMGSLASHVVEEHEDKTITVSPSIRVDGVEPRVYTPEERANLVTLVGEEYAADWERGRPGWHGYLERGVWREA